jgi:hypothetical protein
MYGIFSSARRPLMHLRKHHFPRAVGASHFPPSLDRLHRSYSSEKEFQDEEDTFFQIADDLDNAGKDIDSGLREAGTEIAKVYTTMARSIRKLNPAFDKIHRDIQQHKDDIAEQKGKIDSNLEEYKKECNRLEEELTNKIKEQKDSIKDHEKDLKELEGKFNAQKIQFENFVHSSKSAGMFYTFGIIIGGYILFQAQQEVTKTKQQLDEVRLEQRNMAELREELKTQHAETKIATEHLKIYITNQKEAKEGRSIEGIRGEFRKTEEQLQSIKEKAKQEIAQERANAIKSVQQISVSSAKELLLAQVDGEISRIQLKWNDSLSSFYIASFFWASHGYAYQYQLRALKELRSEIMNLHTSEFKCSDKTKKLINDAYMYWPEEDDRPFKEGFMKDYINNSNNQSPQLTLRK